MQPSGDGGDEAGLLAEMVREAERVIDHQVSVLKELERKSDRVTTTAQGLLAGAVILITFVTARVPTRADLPFLVLFSLAGLVNAVALLRSLDSFIGPRHHEAVSVGPSVDWIHRRSQERGWDAADHRLSVVRGLAEYERDNQDFMRRKADKVSTNLRLVSWAVATYAASLLYVLWRPELL